MTLGPWLAELYPPALRAATTSLFGVIAFLVASAIWSRLPETPSTRRAG